MVQYVANTYLTIINASLVNDAGEAVDTGPLYQNGVPTMANVIVDN